MPSEDNHVLEFNQYQKSDKTPFVLDVDLEYLIENIDKCKKNPENSSTRKVSGDITSKFPMSTISSLKK